jgi:hypothetical protein
MNKKVLHKEVLNADVDEIKNKLMECFSKNTLRPKF